VRTAISVNAVGPHGEKHARTDETHQQGIAPQKCAAAIVRAVARRRREVVITGHGRLFVFVHRHAPWLTSFVIRRFGVRSRREPGR